MYNYDQLNHYGILGMKWGVRRYQNYDGSYTKKGLARYNKKLSEYESLKSKKRMVLHLGMKLGRQSENSIPPINNCVMIKKQSKEKHCMQMVKLSPVIWVSLLRPKS